eukprot:m.682816 g.682816  ORF g.682816 m.682816 type:complete len:199 (+) comp22823_c0_seq14:1459-2055(+)
MYIGISKPFDFVFVRVRPVPFTLSTADTHLPAREKHVSCPLCALVIGYLHVLQMQPPTLCVLCPLLHVSKCRKRFVFAPSLSRGVAFDDGGELVPAEQPIRRCEQIACVVVKFNREREEIQSQLQRLPGVALVVGDVGVRDQLVQLTEIRLFPLHHEQRRAEHVSTRSAVSNTPHAGVRTRTPWGRTQTHSTKPAAQW